MNECSRSDVIVNAISKSDCFNTMKLMTAYDDSDWLRLKEITVAVKKEKRKKKLQAFTIL